jgi:hypothetical protein
MDFNERGFLGEAIEEWRKKLIPAHQAHFTFAYDVHEFCQRAKFEVKVHNRDGQEIVVASLFFKMLSDYQGAIILLERGMVAQGQALLRCTLEAYFLIKRSVEDDSFHAVWARSDQIDRLRMLQAVGAGEGGLPPTVDAIELDTKIADVRRQVEESEAKRIRVKDVIQEKEGEWLPSLYMLWSFSVHSTPRTVNKYVQGGPLGLGIQGFNWGPCEDSLDFTLAWGGSVMLAVWSPLGKLFDLSVADEVGALEARFGELIPNRLKRDPGSSSSSP